MTDVSAFAADVLAGLTTTPRRLPSRWFYDEAGSRLFQEIMATPEYYLTEAEAEIFRDCAADIVAATGVSGTLDLIELGAGDGSKTRYLIDGFLGAGINLTYRPIDISSSALSGLATLVRTTWPDMPFAPINDDYFVALEQLGRAESTSAVRRLVLFPGANIGNFTPAEATEMLCAIRELLRPGDLLLTGFDLKKNPATILAAYNDAAGKTAAFNLNLLARINHELGGSFALDHWHHWETYNPVTGAARSFLVCEADQQVWIEHLGRRFDFAAHEAIAVEISQKYSLPELTQLAAQTGFDVVRDFTDRGEYFVDALWRRR